MKGILVCATLLFLTTICPFAYAQCPGALGDQVTYGAGNWIGYVYDGSDNFLSSNYQGYFTESEIFDESFCGTDCSFILNGCTLNTETFTVRFKMNKTFSNSVYRLTIGGDDGVRLSMNAGSSYLLDGWMVQAYKTYSVVTTLNGNYNIWFDYFEGGGGNRVSYNIVNLGPAYGGAISSGQTLCQTGVLDPLPFTSVDAAMFVTGSAIQYQWEKSTNLSTWTDVASATSITYDIPSGFSGTVHYRRRAYDGISTYAYSNTVTVIGQVPMGDQITYGVGSWIGYVYDGSNNFTSNYVGKISEPATFDESFGGATTTFLTDGCDMYTETFSVRFKMQKTLPCGNYTFTVGADDGVRLSIDGGASWLINDYSDHAFRTTSSAVVNVPDGVLYLVLEYYEGALDNRISFNYSFISCALPIELISFEGENFNDKNVLKWTTASELNNSGFEVQRSRNGIQFDSIAWVIGKGTSKMLHKYSFVDEKSPPSRSYYRLRQIDYAGDFDYSGVIKVDNNDKSNVTPIEVYPNPSSSRFRISQAHKVKSIKVFDSLTYTEVGFIYEGDEFLLKNSEAGMYLVFLYCETGLIIQKIVLMN